MLIIKIKLNRFNVSAHTSSVITWHQLFYYRWPVLFDNTVDNALIVQIMSCRLIINNCCMKVFLFSRVAQLVSQWTGNQMARFKFC